MSEPTPALPYNGTTGYNVGSDTSEDAARAAVENTGVLQDQIVALLDRAGPEGMTSAHVERALGGRQSTISANLRSMEIENYPARGRVVTLVARRETPTGRAAHPYVLARHADRLDPDLVREPTPPRSVALTPDHVLDWIARHNDAGLIRQALRRAGIDASSFEAIREYVRTGS